MTTHDFDLEHWIRLFPLESYDGDTIYSNVGPALVCFAEQIRRQISAGKRTAVGVPTDLFVCGRGEPRSRTRTKVGGVPYRPADRPWPTRPDGKPYTFVAQFDFRESVDILPDLPGDLLLAFFADYAAYPFDEMFPVAPYFEWQNVGLKRPVPRPDVPSDGFTVPLYYGCRFRTVDLHSNARVIRDAKRLIPAGAVTADLDWLPWGDNWVRSMILQCARLKIGGLPFFNHETEERVVSWTRDKRFLATIPSMYGSGDVDYPFVNVRQKWAHATTLSWSSGGFVHLFLDGEGIVHPWFEQDPFEAAGFVS